MRYLTFTLCIIAAVLRLHGEPQQCARTHGLDGVAGYYTQADKYQHAIVANNGSLYEIFFNQAKGIFQSHLGRFRDTVAIAGYSAPADAGRQSVIIARGNGEIHQLWFNAAGISSALLDRVTGTVDVGALYSYDTGRQHAVAVTSGGDVVELAWLPAAGVRRTTLTNIPGASHVAGFFTLDDHRNIVLVATTSGDVWEIFYSDPTKIGRSVIFHAPEPIIDLAGFYTDDDNFRHAIVGMASGTIQEVFYHPVKGKGTPVLRTIPGMRHLAAYTTVPDDHWRHVIVGMDDGTVQELFYDPAKGQGLGVLRSFPAEFTTAEDTSVEGPNSEQPQTWGSTAGLTAAIAGNNVVQYAVSLNAGVWLSTDAHPWRQLPDSPPRALSIAMNPGNALHIAVGERNGDSASSVLDRSGVWESRDGGLHWSYILNPRTIAGCSSQAVPGLVFDKDGNLFVALECGIAERLAGATTFTALAGTGGRAVTNVATQVVGGAVWMWGRTQSDFLLSKDDGATWSRIAIPATIGADTVRRGSRGEDFSLAAFESSAFTIGNTTRGGCAITYDGNSASWSLTDIKDGDGTGLGGRRFTKAFFVHSPAPHWVLLAGTGQGVFMGDVAGGSISLWRRIAETPWPLGPGDRHEFNPVSAIHSDIWDANVADAADPVISISTDGGVYRTTLSSATGNPPGTSPAWTHQNEGLHTHHVHTLTLLTENPARRSKIVYSTADNNEWLRNSTPIVDPFAAWRTWGLQGDSNWTAGDNGSSPVAMITRHPQLTHLTAFGDTAPPAAAFWAQNPRGLVFYPNAGFNAEQFHHVIQTPKDEASNPLLDVVMLAHLPLNSPDPANPVVLIRTRTFAANPDFPTSKFASPAWTVEDAALPPGAQRVWAAGGHNIQGGPTYYLYCENGGTPRVYRRAGPGSPWVDLTPAIADPLPGVPYLAVHGPLFVNPYDRNHLYVLTARGVRVSTDGGTTFSDETVLTALLTGSAKYPVTARYSGGNPDQVVHYSQARIMGTLSDVVFLRDNPAEVVASSPFTGVFYRNAVCGTWQNVTQFLPTPLPAIGSVGVDHEAIYAAFEGRSVWRVLAYELAPVATFYSRTGLAPGDIARLLFSDGSAVAGQSVQVTVTTLTGTEAFSGPLTTRAGGGISLPPLPAGSYVVHADFRGALGTAASATSFTITI